MPQRFMVSSRSFPLRLLPRLPCDKACSICWIGRIPLSLFLAGKMSHRKAVSFDRPPTFRRPMGPGLYRHHLIGFVGVGVGHFPFTRRDLATTIFSLLARL